jgi:hypothetical protein
VPKFFLTSFRAGTAGGAGWRSLGQHLYFEQIDSAATEVKRNSEIESPSLLGEKAPEGVPKADEGPSTFATPHEHWEFPGIGRSQRFLECRKIALADVWVPM